jgi:hypothetical protein
VVSRVCLNLLRARQARREESLESFTPDWLGAADEDRIPQAAGGAVQYGPEDASAAGFAGETADDLGAAVGGFTFFTDSG